MYVQETGNEQCSARRPQIKRICDPDWLLMDFVKFLSTHNGLSKLDDEIPRRYNKKLGTILIWRSCKSGLI